MIKNKTIIIGITGGLASGKSTAAGILHELIAALVIDADKIGHGLMEPDSACWRKIAKAPDFRYKLQKNPVKLMT